MLVHFLSGAAGGFANVFLNLSPLSLWLLAIGLLIAWEIAEYAAGVREELENRALDLAIGLLGVLASTTLARRLDVPTQWVLFAASASLLAAGCFLGWRAYRMRKTAD